MPDSQSEPELTLNELKNLITMLEQQLKKHKEVKKSPPHSFSLEIFRNS